MKGNKKVCVILVVMAVLLLASATSPAEACQNLGEWCNGITYMCCSPNYCKFESFVPPSGRCVAAGTTDDMPPFPIIRPLLQK